VSRRRLSATVFNACVDVLFPHVFDEIELPIHPAREGQEQNP